MADKRQLPEAGNSPPSPGSTSLVLKKARHEGALVGASVAPGGGGTLSVPGGSVPRTSDLLAPIMKLSGHQGEVLSGRFSPCGSFLATGGFDKDLMLWQVFDGCRNFCVLRGHSKAVLQLTWGHDSTRIYSASADKTLMVWDAEYGERVARLTGHSSHVNSVAAARQTPHMLVSGSNDSTCRIWDARVRGPVRTLRTRFQSTSVEVSADGGRLFSGGLENVVRVYDLRKGGDDVAEDSVAFELQGHTDTITGLRLSPDGSHLLSNAMDSTVRAWDVRPFVLAETRATQLFVGAQHNYEKNLLRCGWSADGTRVCAGSSDWFVYVWDAATGKIAYKLPGHRGCVNEVDFHPTQPIVASCSSDKSAYLGEIEAS